MGLPSGLMWAKNDIDVSQLSNFTPTPFQYEKTFYSWGNINGYNPISESAFGYDWGGINAEAPYYDGQTYGDTPGASITANLTTSQDAARVALGAPWRMPTTEEFKELFDNCDFVQADGSTIIDAAITDKRVTVNGIEGIYLKSKNNGNLLFFACSGAGSGTTWSNRGSYGNYWSCSFSNARYARRLTFDSVSVNPQYNGNRYYGFAVRAVFGKGISSNSRGISIPVDDERLEREVNDSRLVINNERNVQE